MTLEALLLDLRRAGLCIGVTEELRLRQVLPAVLRHDEAELEALRQVLRALLLKSPEAGARFEAVYQPWLAQQLARREPQGEAAARARRLPQRAAGPRLPRGGWLRGRWPRARVVVALVALLAAGLCLVPRRPPPPKEKPPGPALTVTPPESKDGPEIKHPIIERHSALVPTLRARRVGGVRLVGPPLLVLLGALALSGGVGLWWRRRVQRPQAAAAVDRRRGLLRVQPQPAPPELALLDARQAEALVYGIGKFEAEEESPRLDVPRSVARSAAAGGVPSLLRQPRRHLREVWLWQDTSLSPAGARLAGRLGAEISDALRRAGLAVERAEFDEIPRDLLGASGPFQPLDVEERRDRALVAILTDGRWLLQRLHAERTRAGVAVVLRGLSGWPRLCFVALEPDREGALRAALQPRGLVVLKPEQLAAFLAAGELRRGGKIPPPPARVLRGEERVWAAVLSLAAHDVSEDEALALRKALKLRAPAFALRELQRRFPGPLGRLRFPVAERQRLRRWLMGCEGAGPGSLLRRAQAAALGLLEAEEARQARGAEWAVSAAARHLRAERALLRLWEEPTSLAAARRVEQAVRELSSCHQAEVEELAKAGRGAGDGAGDEASDGAGDGASDGAARGASDGEVGRGAGVGGAGRGVGDVKAFIEGELALLAPREIRDPVTPDRVPLPFALADLSPLAQHLLFQLGLAKGLLRGREVLLWPGRLPAVLGLCGGLLAAAVLTTLVSRTPQAPQVSWPEGRPAGVSARVVALGGGRYQVRVFTAARGIVEPVRAGDEVQVRVREEQQGCQQGGWTLCGDVAPPRVAASPRSLAVVWAADGEQSAAAPVRPERSAAAPVRPERSAAAPVRPERSAAAPVRPERSAAESKDAETRELVARLLDSGSVGAVRVVDGPAAGLQAELRPLLEDDEQLLLVVKTAAQAAQARALLPGWRHAALVQATDFRRLADGLHFSEGAAGRLLAQQWRWANPAVQGEPRLRGLCPRLYGQAGDMAMVRVCGGEFAMGSKEFSDTKPVTRLRVSQFWLGQQEVSNRLYLAFDRKHEGRFTDQKDLPVETVDWNQARAYCASQGMRLPSEAEWEYAARGVDGRRYPWGDQEPTPERAVFGLSYSKDKPVPVDGDTPAQRAAAADRYQAGAGPFGALHQAGNLWEWVQDCYQDHYPTEGVDNFREGSDSPREGVANRVLESCQADSDGDNTPRRVLRGGSFDFEPVFLRSANRVWYPPVCRFRFIGFRCVRGARQHP